MRKRLKDRDRIELWESMDRRCSYCGCELEYKNMQIDHIEPLAFGGEDIRANMTPSCRSCNSRKGMFSLEAFRKEISNQPKVLSRDSVTFKNALRFGQVSINDIEIVFYFEKRRCKNDTKANKCNYPNV